MSKLGYIELIEIINRNALGFDQFLNFIDKSLTHAEKFQTYPPYNIRKIDSRNIMLEVAVAGFNKDEIDISVEDGKLSVKGQKTVDPKFEYLYKGIADRTFIRNYSLADTIVVKNASILDGILYILLENVIPEERKPRKIIISEVSSSPTEKLYKADSDRKAEILAENTASIL